MFEIRKFNIKESEAEVPPNVFFFSVSDIRHYYFHSVGGAYVWKFNKRSVLKCHWELLGENVTCLYEPSRIVWILLYLSRRSWGQDLLHFLPTQKIVLMININRCTYYAVNITSCPLGFKIYQIAKLRYQDYNFIESQQLSKIRPYLPEFNKELSKDINVLT